MTEFQGDREAAISGCRFCLVVSRFHELVTDQLLDGARSALVERGIPPEAIDVVHVSGAWEIPSAVRWAAARDYDAFVALGCVIRGETPHFDYVCHGVVTGLEAAARDLDVPIGFGILTTDDLEQALQRVGGTHGHKGEEAAAAALELCALRRSLTMGDPPAGV